MKNRVLGLCLPLSLFTALYLALNISALAQEQTVLAQNTVNTNNQQVDENVRPIDSNKDAISSTIIVGDQSKYKASPILRLQDTIRANKEQPQVLTIVPWQLPVHQRIDEDKQWQLQVVPMAAIERNAFLKNLNVLKEIEAAKNQ